MISREFKIAVKLASEPAWKIAAKVGVNPNVLSRILTGALQVRPGDERVRKIASVIGLSIDECFEKK